MYRFYRAGPSTINTKHIQPARNTSTATQMLSPLTALPATRNQRTRPKDADNTARGIDTKNTPLALQVPAHAAPPLRRKAALHKARKHAHRTTNLEDGNKLHTRTALTRPPLPSPPDVRAVSEKVLSLPYLRLFNPHPPARLRLHLTYCSRVTLASFSNAKVVLASWSKRPRAAVRTTKKTTTSDRAATTYQNWVATTTNINTYVLEAQRPSPPETARGQQGSGRETSYNKPCGQ